VQVLDAQESTVGWKDNTGTRPETTNESHFGSGGPFQIRQGISDKEAFFGPEIMAGDNSPGDYRLGVR
jgi:hypothetical protein